MWQEASILHGGWRHLVLSLRKDQRHIKHHYSAYKRFALESFRWDLGLLGSKVLDNPQKSIENKITFTIDSAEMPGVTAQIITCSEKEFHVA